MYSLLSLKVFYRTKLEVNGHLHCLVSETNNTVGLAPVCISKTWSCIRINYTYRKVGCAGKYYAICEQCRPRSDCTKRAV